jgi:hypothetical protein
MRARSCADASVGGRPARPADAPQERDQPDVAQTMGQLLAVARLEVREQVELATVVGAVAAAVQRHDVVGVVAAAQRARHHVRRLGRPSAADKAGVSRDLVPLRLRRDAERNAAQRGAAPQRLAPAQPCLRRTPPSGKLDQGGWPFGLTAPGWPKSSIAGTRSTSR